MSGQDHNAAGDPGEQALASRKRRDAALVLPFAGFALIAPPIIDMFADDRPILGVPLIALYLFGVWAALILCAFALSRRLREESER